MNVCVVSFKECWRDQSGRWCSYGGFPAQMSAIASLFDRMTLVIVEGKPRSGGVLLPDAQVVPMKRPAGENARRKLSVVTGLPHYVGHMAKHVWNSDVVHVPLPGDLALLGMVVAVALRKPVIARYGGSWVCTSRTTLMNRVTRTLMRLLAGGQNVMFATGEEAAPPWPGVDWIFASAITQSELDSIKADVARGLHTPSQVVYVGRLSPEKGVDNLVRAVSELHGRGFNRMPLVTLIGDGPARADIVSMVQHLGCARYFRFTGQLNREHLSAELLKADFAIQPSLSEGFSKAWLDAMAHGVPVISSEVGAARSVLGAAGERGWLVPPGDHKVLADMIETVITHQWDWHAIRSRCRQYVEQRTLEAWAAQIGTACASRWGLHLREGNRSELTA